MILRVAALAFTLVASAPAHAQVNQGNQPPLIRREQGTYAEPSVLAQWIKDNVPSENILDLATMIPGSAVVWVDRSTVTKADAFGEAWQHWEIYDAATAEAVGFRSFKILQRYQCAEGGTVHIEGLMYSGNDLTGTSTEVPPPGANAWKALNFVLWDDLRHTVCEGTYFFDEKAP
ncbi:surface-adhesin E family protein [Brevundimonas goettingensis]|uniref:Surface-adhesin protein E-like domain-containing protein n=1 Tax=Brevundimonas goettingensis TaxID=2774190 RepID=A0A975C1Y0_9CAUL|nr:surface-adhesin E family protein [Brevundimonas goettingensis]QTC92356.1 hypothetical protein IFJ75_05550 [Brevundimonas goettingensis]